MCLLLSAKNFFKGSAKLVKLLANIFFIDLVSLSPYTIELQGLC